MINKSALVQELEKGSTIKLVFQSLNSGDLKTITCDRPPVLGRQNIGSDKLIVWRHDEKSFEDISWASIKSWSV